MKPDLELKLATMLRSNRLAGLGTLREGSPLVSMVAYVAADDFNAFYIHISQLAQHTRDMLNDQRVGLLVAEADDGRPDPQTLARVSILGQAQPVAPEEDDYALARTRYVNRFPQSEMLFSFGDFGLWRILPQSARYVAGFAQAFNLSPDALKRVSQI